MKRFILFAALAAATACSPELLDSGDRPELVVGEHETLLNGVRQWYRVAGNPVARSEPVIFLHGGPGQGSVHFAELVGGLLELSLRMVYFDQRASGRSDRSPDGACTTEMLTTDLEALRQELGVERMALIGQSFGGTLALEYGQKHTSAFVPRRKRAPDAA